MKSVYKRQESHYCFIAVLKCIDTYHIPFHSAISCLVWLLPILLSYRVTIWQEKPVKSVTPIIATASQALMSAFVLQDHSLDACGRTSSHHTHSAPCKPHWRRVYMYCSLPLCPTIPSMAAFERYSVVGLFFLSKRVQDCTLSDFKFFPWAHLYQAGYSTMKVVWKRYIKDRSHTTAL